MMAVVLTLVRAVSEIESSPVLLAWAVILWLWENHIAGRPFAETAAFACQHHDWIAISRGGE